ncbi:hypothetical protein GE061_011759 [Apolygus lucorum]|uniref:Lipid-binding serum glycoprotein N-terminal domain-containing protein n=1 Tax=Apolygus lucorum TaxID=248454 RepID=A0A6A4KBM5_APOLU|nr:hypothetical protein GE061_011759 [Apolygus lucorum]
MLKHQVLISLSALCAVVATSSAACVSWDSKIEPLFLEPFRETLRNTTSENIAFEDGKVGGFGFEVSWENGTVGNFSTVGLSAVGGSSSAQVCTTGNVRRLTLDMNVRFDVLHAHFGDFVFSLPIFKTRDAKAIFTSTGNNALVTLSATQDVTSNRCSVSLDNFEFTSWGTIELTLRGNAGRNLVAEMLFNAHRAKIVKFLSKVGVGKKINTYARDRLSDALLAHSDSMCKIMAVSDS